MEGGIFASLQSVASGASPQGGRAKRARAEGPNQDDDEGSLIKIVGRACSVILAEQRNLDSKVGSVLLLPLLPLPLLPRLPGGWVDAGPVLPAHAVKPTRSASGELCRAGTAMVLTPRLSVAITLMSHVEPGSAPAGSTMARAPFSSPIANIGARPFAAVPTAWVSFTW